MAYTTIDDPSEYFTTTLYTGDGTTPRSITGLGLQPDLLWFKSRNSADAHFLYDTNRGVHLAIRSNGTNAETSNTEGVKSFDSDGWTMGNFEQGNFNGNNYVNWGWKCTASTSSNTDGSITSTVQANTEAGFSIVTYTGNGIEGATFGHGLGVAPELVIIKGRSHADNWPVFNGTSTTASRSLHLEGTDAEIPVSSYNFWNLYWDETRPSSTVVTLGIDAKLNGNTRTFVAYCFNSIQGYSKILKYIGNGSTNGAFVYTGFKPAWVLAKRTDSANSWVILDNKRNTSNAVTNYLQPNATDAEGTSGLDIDFLSNGFKWRTTSAAVNANGGSYLCVAFAESPFVSSQGVPTTAR